MDADVALLEHLVGDRQVFARERWGRRPLHRAAAGDFHDLLDVGRIEALLLSGARRPAFRLVHDGETLPPERSTARVRLAGRTLDDVADVGRIAEALDGGATLVLQGLQRTTVELARFARSLERALSHPVQVNAYLTPAGAKGLTPHRDEHDVLILQVEGTKRWEVEGLDEVETVPGDVLYLPCGVRHAAAAQATSSLHLTVGILRVTQRAAVQRALAQLPDLDRPLPLGFARPEGTADLSASLADAFAAVAHAAAAVELDAVAALEAARSAARLTPLAEGQLAAVLAVDDLTTDHVVTRRRDCHADLHPDLDEEGRLVLELTGRRLRVPDAMRAALERLLELDPVIIADLPGLADADQLVLVRRMVREGVVVPAP